MATKDEKDTLPNVDQNSADAVYGNAPVAPVLSPKAVEALAEDSNTFTLKVLKEEDLVTPGFVTLEYVAEKPAEASNGEVFRTGVRKEVSAVDAKVLLELKVDGKTAFKEV